MSQVIDGTNGQTYPDGTVQTTAFKNDGNVAIAQQTLHIQKQAASGVSGGAGTAGAYNTRPLDTIIKNTITGASLTSNQITLPAGTYKIWAYISTYSAGSTRTRLRNITDSSNTLLGLSEYSNTGSPGSASQALIGAFTLTSTKVLELQQWIQFSQGSNLGIAVSSGDNEVFANVLIVKE